MPSMIGKLRKLLKAVDASPTGVVQSVDATQAFVRTARGINAYSLGGFSPAPGDRVTLSATAVIGVMPSASSIPVYDV